MSCALCLLACVWITFELTEYNKSYTSPTAPPPAPQVFCDASGVADFADGAYLCDNSDYREGTVCVAECTDSCQDTGGEVFERICQPDGTWSGVDTPSACVGIHTDSFATHKTQNTTELD